MVVLVSSLSPSRVLLQTPPWVLNPPHSFHCRLLHSTWEPKGPVSTAHRDTGHQPGRVSLAND